jgi:hypothetical protein
MPVLPPLSTVRVGTPRPSGATIFVTECYSLSLVPIMHGDCRFFNDRTGISPCGAVSPSWRKQGK